MTLLAEPEADAQPGAGLASSSASPTLRQRWRRGRLLVGAGVLVLLAVIVLAAYDASQPGGELDPRSYTPQGAHALAVLLGQRGVAVTTSTDPAAAAQAARAGSTLVVVRPDYLDAGQLAALARTSADLVVVGATPESLQGLGFGAAVQAVDEVGSVGDATRRPDCTLGAAQVAGPARMGGIGYQLTGAGTGCYPIAGGGVALASFDSDGRSVTLLGSGSFLGNAELAKQGDAALALGLLDTHPDVEWLAPTVVTSESSADGSNRSLESLLPARLRWAVLQLAIAVVLLAAWRARRLGRLVAEDLPVVVRQAETVVGRGRLYQRSQARERAAQALRTGCRDRLAAQLHLAGDHPPQAVVDAVATRTGRAPGAVGGLLYGGPPADDRALVALSRALSTLEQEVLRP